MSFDRTAALAYLKERWIEPDAIMQALIVNSPVLGMMEKVEAAGGRYIHVPLLRTGAQGRSAVHATAVTNAVSSKTIGFDVTYGSNYQLCQIDGNTLDDMANKENALFDAIDCEMEAGIANLKKDLRLQTFGNIGGARGQVLATPGGTDYVITLKNIEDAVHFEENMEICAAATDGTSGSLRDSGDAITLTAIDRNTGILTSDEYWSAIASIATDDYLFAEGDFGAKWAGILSWIPAATPAATAFFGVDRTLDVNRLSGVRYTATGEPIESAFLNAAAKLQLLDGQATVGVVNPVKWAQLANSLGADRLNRVQLKDYTGRVGYDAIQIVTANGFIPIVSDPGCQVGYGLLLDMKTWKCQSVGKLVHVIDDDGLLIRRAASGDIWNIELKSRGNFTCNNPGRNCRLIF